MKDTKPHGNSSQVPDSFHQAVMQTLHTIQLEEEKNMKPEKIIRPASRIVLIAAVLGLALASVAYAAVQWDLFEKISFLTGGTPRNADQIMSSNLHKETVNGVEIEIREAGYDGRTLFLQYSYRLPNATETFEENWDEGMEKIYDLGVGWWTDNFWINGNQVDMAANSGSVMRGSTVPGEIIQTEYWRLDNLDISLNGKVEIALPIGARPDSSTYAPRKDHPEKYDENGNMLLPETGVVTFKLDTGDAAKNLITEHPEVETATDKLTAKVSEVCFSPIMTYITLDLKANPAAMADFIKEHGEGAYDENGQLIYAYDEMDLFHSWLDSLTLVDANGSILFPDHFGLQFNSNTDAEFLFPCIESILDKLYLAPIVSGQADMTQAVTVR